MSTAESPLPTLRVPNSLTLMPFQEDTVRRTLYFLSTTKSHACYVASEMGLGKTVTSLVTASTLQASKTLILCPAIMRLVWQDEIYKWCRFSSNEIPKVTPILSAADATASSIGQAAFVICSYTLATQAKVLRLLASFHYDLLILDEAHLVKNLTAKRTRASFKDLWPVSTNHILLSGTPMTRNVVDCYTAFHAIMPETFPNFGDFALHYSFVRFTPWGTDFYGLKNAEELSRIIRANFYIRYKKEDVLPQLPPKVFTKITLPPEYSLKVSEKQAQALYREKASVLDQIYKDKFPIVPPNLAEHRRLQGEAKVAPIAEFVEGLLEQEIPVVLFAYHKNVIDSLSKLLSKFNPVVITGDTPPTKRAEAIQAFQNHQTLLFIGNFIAAGVGVTLTAASTIVLAELDWIPSTISQAIDRLHRIGQLSTVQVYYFIVQASLDMQIEEALISRARQFKTLLDDKTST